jgi:hypothetical protein
MDTLWFAVDADGRVAVFDTGENGHAPTVVDQGSDGFYDLWDLFDPAVSGASDNTSEVAKALGLFYFGYNENYEPIAPYRVESAPEAPLHVDQLPAPVREQCRQVIFHSLRFTDTERIQPLDFFPCNFWSDYRVAYLAADEVTIRPIPGQEAKFAEFVARFKQEQSDGEQKYKFAWPDETTSERSEP